MSETETDEPKPTIASDGDTVDVVVLGVGTCGEDLSLRLLGAGLDVVGIEAALVGGECAYWACLPSKMMIRAANVLQEARRVDGMAGRAEVTPDWDLLAARVRTEVTGGWDDSIAVERFEGRGGRLVHGRGKLTGPRTVTVGDESFTARRGCRDRNRIAACHPSDPGTGRGRLLDHARRDRGRKACPSRWSCARRRCRRL